MLPNKYLKSIKKIDIYILLILSVPFFMGTFLKQSLSIIDTSFPFREAYYPTVSGILITYILPIALGYVMFRFIDKRNISNPIYYVNITLFSSLFLAIPVLLNSLATSGSWYEFDIVVYYLILFPILFMIGGALSGIGMGLKIKPRTGNYMISSLDLIIALLIGFFVFIFNVAPTLNSKYLVGADVYYHSAMSQHILDGNSITSSPLFKEGSNYYPSIGYHIIAYTSKITHIGLDKLWILSPAVFAFVLITFFYLFLKRVTGDTWSAALATLLLIPYRQVLWPDPSLKDMAYAFMAIFLFSFVTYLRYRSKNALVASVIFVILSGLSHPEIALHLIGIMLSYVVLKKTDILKFVSRLFKQKTRMPKASVYMPSMDSTVSFSILIFIYALILSQQILLATRAYPGGKTCVFNEVSLSACQPIGIISFVPFLLLPAALATYFKVKKNEHIFIFAITSLFATTIFYFSHVWALYHRYFSETAYFGIVAISGLMLKDLINGRRLILVTVCILVAASLYPKAMFQNEYSKSTNKKLSNEQQTFDLIKSNTKPHSVVMLRSSDFINRHIPFYTDRYIFAGDSKISKEAQFQVLSTCNGPFAKECENRSKISRDFFNNPKSTSIQNVEKKYSVDYMLIGPNDPIATYINSEEDVFRLIGKNSNYMLYEVIK